jgi:hypothetical protein
MTLEELSRQWNLSPNGDAMREAYHNCPVVQQIVKAAIAMNLPYEEVLENVVVAQRRAMSEYQNTLKDQVMKGLVYHHEKEKRKEA